MVGEKIKLQGYGVNSTKSMTLQVESITDKTVVFLISSEGDKSPKNLVKFSLKSGLCIGREEAQSGFRIPVDTLTMLNSGKDNEEEEEVYASRKTGKKVVEPKPEEDDEELEDTDEDFEEEEEEEEEEDEEDQDDEEEDEEIDSLEELVGKTCTFEDSKGREKSGEITDFDDEEDELEITVGKRTYWISSEDVSVENDEEEEPETVTYILRVSVECPEGIEPEDIEETVKDILERHLDGNEYGEISVSLISEENEEDEMSTATATKKTTKKATPVKPETTRTRKTSPVVEEKPLAGKRGRPAAVSARPEAGKGQVEVQVSMGLYDSVTENGLRAGKNTPEKTAFVKSWKAAVEEKNTQYVILGKDEAVHFVTVVLPKVASGWAGVAGGAFRRAAKGLVGKLVVAFKIPVKDVAEDLRPEGMTTTEDKPVTRRRAAK